MLGLKEQIFGDVGYSTDLKLSAPELNTFRDVVSDHWLQTINHAYPALFDEAKEVGIENYHTISDRLNHHTLWPKRARVLPQDYVNTIKSLPFIDTLKQEFGDFTISDVIDTEQHYNQEEIYWRLVRPGVPTDVGQLHKDIWFHGAANSGYGMFPPGVVTVKAWIPIFCSKGKSGLAILGGSHLMDWKYHIEVVDGIGRPIPDEDLSGVGAALVPTDPGNILLFNEGILHGGVVNAADKTRVSAEITLVLKKAV